MNDLCSSNRVNGTNIECIIFFWGGLMIGWFKGSEFDTLVSSGLADRSKPDALTETELVDMSQTDSIETGQTDSSKGNPSTGTG